MAIYLEFYNLLIRREAIEKKYPGGWKSFSEENPANLVDYWDDHLFRTGAMNAYDIEGAIGWAEKLGLVGLSDGSEPVWVDFCPFEFFFMNQEIYRCPWLVWDGATVYLKGTEKGDAVGRNNEVIAVT